MEDKKKWDKVFPKNENVVNKKVSFTNNFGIDLVGDLYLPKNIDKKLPALAISGPFGAVKEQASGLYGQILAERGFIALAFDPSFTGESGGRTRNVASPDINTEDFLAAVDFLSNYEEVDPEKIGIIGICGWGGLAINAAALDARIKATVAVTMYDMARNISYGYGDSYTPEDRRKMREDLACERTKEFGKEKRRAGGVVDPLPDDAAQFVKDYHAYYKTERGYHPRSLNSNEGWNITGTMSYLNTSLMNFAGEIENPVMIIHGDQAHSYVYGKDAFKKLKGDNKEFVSIPGASHVDLYDQVDIIPFDRIEEFFKKSFEL